MVKIFYNRTAEYLIKQGLEMTKKPVCIEKNVDLAARESVLESLLGKHTAYAVLKVGENQTIAYALRQRECCGNCE